MAIETQNGYPSIRITAGERVLRKAAELVPYEGNPRRHGEKQMQALRRSLREFGFLRPLLIDRENRLVAGQAVLQAAMAEGMDVVPCILAEGLTAEQRRAYILADNRLAELAEWDRQALRVELQALNDLGFDLELTGFSLEALPFRLDGEPPAAEEDAEAPVQGRAPLESGRCYQLGRHRLYGCAYGWGKGAPAPDRPALQCQPVRGGQAQEPDGRAAGAQRPLGERGRL